MTDTDGMHLLSAAERNINSFAFHECRLFPSFNSINTSNCWGHLIAVGY